MSLTGEEGGVPAKMGLSVADLSAALFATIGVLACLQAPAATGIGQHVQTSLLEAQVAMLSYDLTSYFATGEVPVARADTGEDVRTEASLAKLCAGDWGARRLDHAIQIHGGMGETLELPLTLFYRLLRHAQVGGGTSEIHRMLIARSLLR
jgi:alkylation response protein AidB-like acyl-CoA dehydrogenase